MTDNVLVNVRFSGKLRRLASIDKQAIMSTINNLVDKHRRTIKYGSINMDIKQNGIKYRQIPLFECKANFYNKEDSGKVIVATGEEYGIWQTVDKALNRIERKIVEYKERNLGL